jgi:hypothetical protein
MDNRELALSLIAHYPDLHPLLVLRSVEHAQTEEEVDKILSSLPSIRYPVCWHEPSRAWTPTSVFRDRV